MKKFIIIFFFIFFLQSCLSSEIKIREKDFTINKSIENEIKEMLLISEKGKWVILSNLKENQALYLPFFLKWEVPTNWIFEWVFPLEIRDKENNLLYQSHGNANIFDESWEVILPSVSFESLIDFSLEKETEAILTLKADNPSGLDENNDKIEISIVLKKREEVE